ncbi:hypothetical protein [Brenneria tiliae]|uniref:hypothetical protein n=1 Tax=Brenneria tiliae TaxID=2914984 RepID=UPI002014FCE4|nr:hypothetical protein [Brenneria tiliae]MCL2896660.1 hypothetical protein [Brenneria tiliae]MCL2901090.1 hypothetical protein [Brenneria tiliae]
MKRIILATILTAISFSSFSSTISKGFYCTSFENLIYFMSAGKEEDVKSINDMLVQRKCTLVKETTRIVSPEVFKEHYVIMHTGSNEQAFTLKVFLDN